MNILSTEGKPVVGVYEIVIDTADELEGLNELDYIKPGSTALCIENSKKYMLNSSNIWTEVNFKQGGSGGKTNLGSISISENGTYIPTEGLDGFDEVIVNVSGGDSHYSKGIIEFATDTNINFDIIGEKHVN